MADRPDNRHVFTRVAVFAASQVAAIRGKRWYTIGLGSISLLFEDVRSSIGNVFGNMAAILNAPQTLVGQWLIGLFGLSLIVWGIRRGRKSLDVASAAESENQQTFLAAIRQQIEESATVPNRLAMHALRQHTFDYLSKRLTEMTRNLEMYRARLDVLTTGVGDPHVGAHGMQGGMVGREGYAGWLAECSRTLGSALDVSYKKIGKEWDFTVEYIEVILPPADPANYNSRAGRPFLRELNVAFLAKHQHAADKFARGVHEVKVYVNNLARELSEDHAHIILEIGRRG